MSDYCPPGTFKRRLVTWITAGLVLGIVVLLVWLRTPRYQGKTLREWMASQSPATNAVPMKGSEPDAEDQYVQAIRHFGIQAVPAIRRELRAQDSPVAQTIRAFVGNRGLRHPPFTPGSTRRHNAILACQALGPAAKELTPDLAHLIRTDQVSGSSDAAIRALGMIGRTAVPVLMEGLTDQDRTVRYFTTETLQSLCVRDAAAEDAVFDFLRRRYQGPTRSISGASDSARESVRSFAEAMRLALHHINTPTIAIDILGSLGTNATCALPELEDILRRPPDEVVEQHTLKALERIKPGMLPPREGR